MIIRTEQLDTFEKAAEDRFVTDLAGHLRQDYAAAQVRLPERETTVAELSDEELYPLVRQGIRRARYYELTHESTISAFTAVMFEVAPNFDRHNMSQICLKDKTIDPNERLDEILNLLTDEHWDKIRDDYDVNAWEEDLEKADEEAAAEAGAAGAGEPPPATGVQAPAGDDLAATMLNTDLPPAAQGGTAAAPGGADPNATMLNADLPDKPEAPAPTNIDDISFDETMVGTPAGETPPAGPVDIDEISFDETMIDLEAAKKVKARPSDEDLDLDKTVLNIKPEKE